MTRSWLSKLFLLLFVSFIFSLLPLMLRQSSQMSFLNHSFQFSFFSWLGLSGLFFIGLSLYYFLNYHFYKNIYFLSAPQAAWLELSNYSLLLLAPLCFLSLRHYLVAGDLYVRLKMFLIFLLGGVIWLKILRVSQLEKDRPFWSSSLSSWWNSLSKKKKCLALCLSAFIIYNLGSATLISQGMVFSGDEPHYLLITHSLLLDGDLNLKNNYSSHDYRIYMRPWVTIKPHLAPKTEGKYSFHSPGVSLLVFPFYSLGYFLRGFWLHFFTRMAMTLWGALLGLQVYLFLSDFKVGEKISLLTWAIFSFTSPIFFYSFHLYPEIPAALISIYVFRKLFFLNSAKPGKLFLLGLLTTSLLWLHSLKYLFILGPLFLYGSWVVLKKSSRPSSWWFLLLGSGFMTGIYLTFQYYFYRTLSLSAVSWRGAVNLNESLAYLKFLLFGIPFHFRWETLLGYFLDQRDGLLFYSPVYLFALLGFLTAFKNKKRLLWPLLGVIAPYVLFSAWLTQRTGYAPQARPLVAISWGLIYGMLFYLQSSPKKILAAGFKVCLFLSLLFPLLQLKSPYSLYQLTTQGETQRSGELFLHLSNMHFDLTNYLPSFLKIDNHHWWPNWIWLGGLLLVFLLYPFLPVVKKTSLKPGLSLCLVISVTVGLYFWFAYYPRTTLGSPQTVIFPGGQQILLYPFSRVARQEKPGRFKLLEINRDYVFYFASAQPLTHLQLEVGTSRANYRVALDYFDEPIFQGETAFSFRKIELKNPLPYKFKQGLYLYRVRISIWSRRPVKSPPPCWLQIVPSAQTS